MFLRSVLMSYASLLIAAPAAHAQAAPTTLSATATQPAPESLTFDVASIHLAAPIDQAALIASLRAGKRPESLLIEGSRATFTYMSLKELIAFAYKVRTYQVTGPDWMVSDRFDIVAKLPDGASRDDVPAMMQSLLAERFKLTAHRETKDHPVLGLMTGKAGAKLKLAAEPPPLDADAPIQPGQTKVDSSTGPIILTKNPDGSTTYNMGSRGSFTLRIDGQTGAMHMTANGMTLNGFAAMLTSLGGGNGRPVVDLTGLTGNYELAADFSLADLLAGLRDTGIDLPSRPPDSSAGPSDPGGDSTVNDALAKLGLRLEKTHAPVEQLVVDRVEKTATEN